MGTRKTLTVVVAAILAGGIVPQAGRAHDHGPPRTVLRERGRALQRGLLLAYCWTRPTGRANEAVTECADYVWRAPRVVEIPAGARVEIAIYKTQPPKILRLKAWAVAEPFGQPVGPSEAVPISLGRLGRYWRAAFSLPIPCRHYYMHLEGLWEDTDTPGYDGDQDAIWIFHAGTRLPVAVGPKIRAPSCVVPFS